MKIVRLTESDITNIVNYAVNRIIKENIENYQVEDGSLEDVIEGLYEKGTYRKHISSEDGGVVTFEIEGMGSFIYEVTVTLEFEYEYTPATYYDDAIVDSNEHIVDIEIVGYDENGDEHPIEYVKNEAFEDELKKYIDVDYSQYDITNHTQPPY